MRAIRTARVVLDEHEVLEGPRDSQGRRGKASTEHGRSHVKTGPSVRHVCAHRKCVAVRDRARAMSARVRSARQWEPCAFAGDTASVLGWAHNLMFRYTGWWLVLSIMK